MPVYRRLAAVVLAIALIGGGILAAVEIVLGLTGREEWIVPWRDWLRNIRTTPWHDGAVRWSFAGMAVLGVLMLVIALRKGPPELLRVRSVAAAGTTPEGQHIELWVRRRGLESALTRTVSNIDGIGSAHVRIRRERAAVDARSGRREPGNLEEHVQATVHQQLDLIELTNPLRCDVHVQTRQRR